MNPIEEKVQLPDPQTHFLVHPLDLPAARKEFLLGWWLGVFATPQVYTALLAFFWAVSNNYVTPVLVPLVLVVAAGWVGSRLTRGAWDYIPWKRHDRQRPLPGLRISAALVTSLALLAGLVVFMVWASGQDFVPGFSAYPLGMGAAIVLIMVLELAVKLVRGRTLEIVPQVLSTVVVAIALWMGFLLLPAGDAPTVQEMLPGAAILVGVWLIWLLFTKAESRRNHG